MGWVCSDMWAAASRNTDRGENSRVASQNLAEGKGGEEIHVQAPDCALCLLPSVLRDISERGRDLEQILSQYITFVKPAFEEFCLPVSTGSSTHRKASFPGQLVRQEHFMCQSPLPAGAGKKKNNKGGVSVSAGQGRARWGLFVQPLPSR